MVYREPADELARREARAQTGPLLRLDVTGRPGAGGVRGEDGSHGTGGGGDGDRGGIAGRAAPGEPGGKLVVEILSDTRDGMAVVRGTGVAAWQAETPFTNEIGFDRSGEIELVARGGRGGDGGVGGDGGSGATGRSGSDATRYSSGSNGGPGGDGGDGGDGTSGEIGGNGGEVIVRVEDRDTHLLMLVAQDVSGGQGGSAGRNGSGGAGGRGGRGGSSYSWTETESYTDSQGNSQSRTTYHSNSGGSDGPRGRFGRDGSANLDDGPNGPDGRFTIEVTEDGRMKTRATSRYDVELVSFSHRNENDDGIYEPEEKVVVSNVVVLNKGGMELPPHHDVIVRLRDDGWIGPKDSKLTLPRALPAGKTHVFRDEQLELTLRVFRPQQTGGPLAAPETIRLFAELPDVRRSFGAFTTDETEELGRIVVRFPIELSPITSLFSLAPGQAARVRWSITNVSDRAFGVDSTVGRAVGIKLRLEGGELADEHVLFIDAAGQRHSLVAGFEVPVPRLEKKQAASFEGIIAIAPDAPPYTSARLLASAELGHIAAPATVRPIQLQELTVRVGQPFDAKGAEVLLVTNNRTTREEVDAWRRLMESLGLTSSVWDASLEGGMSVLGDIATGVRSFRLVILLNNSMDTASGERRASVLVDKETVHALARAGTQLLYVGRAPEMDVLAVPVHGDADEHIEVQRWYHWPWSEPKEIDLEERARDIVSALSRAFPDRRFVAVHRFDPSVANKVATSRKVKLGTVEIRRTFDAAPGRIHDVEVDAKEMHRADFVSSDATFALAMHALPFSQKLRLLETSSVAVSAVLFDLVREQRALARHGWRSGANAEQLATWMPMLSELDAAFAAPIDLASPHGQNFVELVASLDLVARGHDRWFEWVPPLLWLRRGIMLRGVVRAALTRLVEKACADPKAAWAAIAARRKELRKKQKDSYDRAVEFTVGRLQDGLSERTVTCDAEVVPPVRVLTGTEYDELAKKEESRAERAQAVVSRAAQARAELLVAEGFAGLAPRIVEQKRIAEHAAAIQEQLQEEERHALP